MTFFRNTGPSPLALPPSPFEWAGARHRGTDPWRVFLGQGWCPSQRLAPGLVDRWAPGSGRHRPPWCQGGVLRSGRGTGQRERLSLSLMPPRPCPRTRWSACLSTTSQPGATTRPSRRPATGVCPAQSPRTRPRTASVRGRPAPLHRTGRTARCPWDRPPWLPSPPCPPGGGRSLMAALSLWKSLRRPVCGGPECQALSLESLRRSLQCLVSVGDL